MNSSCGLNSITTALQQGWLWHLLPHEGWYVIENKESKPKQNSTIFCEQIAAIILLADKFNIIYQ